MQTERKDRNDAGSNTAPAPRRRRDTEPDDDDALIEDPLPLDGYDDDGDSSPGDRRRDPLRQP